MRVHKTEQKNNKVAERHSTILKSREGLSWDNYLPEISLPLCLCVGVCVSVPSPVSDQCVPRTYQLLMQSASISPSDVAPSEPESRKCIYSMRTHPSECVCSLPVMALSWVSSASPLPPQILRGTQDKRSMRHSLPAITFHHLYTALTIQNLKQKDYL